MIYDIQKFAEVEMASLDEYVADPEWVMEQKFDGTRGLVSVTTDKVWWPGRGGGGSLSHTAATQWLPRINPVLQRLVSDPADQIVLDGEILIHTGEFVIFDVVYVRLGGVELIHPTMPFWLRRTVLDSPDVQDALRGDGTRQRVRVARQARTAEEKRAMLAAVEESGGEGVMVKHRYSVYRPGKRIRDSLKVKFVKTADVIVTGSTRGRNDAGRETGSFTLAVVQDGSLVTVGACSAIGKPSVEIGDVIEVAYLYFTGKVGDGSLYQPRMVKVRRDKQPTDCGPDQFPAYSRAVV